MSAPPRPVASTPTPDRPPPRLRGPRPHHHPTPEGSMSVRNEIEARLVSPGMFGWEASATAHQRYAQLLPGRYRNRRRCGCGCGGKVSHSGMANGLALTGGCELSMRRWARDGYTSRPVTTTEGEETP